MQNQKLVFITGGSSGIGLAIAKQYAQSGANVLIGARNIERLNQALKVLNLQRQSQNQNFEALTINVTDYPDLASKIVKAQERMGVPDILINSAGIARTQFIENLSVQDFNDLIQINYLGAVHMIKTLLPGMIARGNGHIVLISSLVGFFNSAGYTAYGASKFALRGLADALRLEMKPKGIKVHIAFPPDTDTPQLAEERSQAPAEVIAMNNGVKMLSPEKVAAIIIRGIERNHYAITPGFETRLLWYLTNGSGSVQRGLLDLLYHQALTQVKKQK
jgi:3-dehydrosphinganine reductase